MAKKTFVLRIEEDAFKILEKWASDDFRSVNGQIEWLLDRAMKEHGRSKKQEDNDDMPDNETQS